MPKQSRNDESLSTAEVLIGRLPGRAIVVVIAGISAAWIAAGSSGFLGHSLCHALTYLALGVAILAAWPWPTRAWKSWVISMVGIVVGLALNGSILPIVNVLGVVLVLATLAYIHGGLIGRAILLSSLAAMTLAVFSLASTAVPVVWQLADVLGWSMGKLASCLTGRPLSIGATFGGIDFLVLIFALYVGWLYNIAPPRRRAGIYAGVAIALAHLVYIVTLAYSEKIAALLPEPFYLQETDISRVGVWAWQNAARTVLPWNLPVLAIILQGIVTGCMFRWVDWLPVFKPDEQNNKSKSGRDEVIELGDLLKDAVFSLGPVILAVLIAALTSLSPGKSDLKGKTLVAFDKGNFSWLRPRYDNPIEGGYGMLPVFVENLGGRFIKSPQLTTEDLAKADLLILLHPNSPFTADQLKRIENYVRQGGALLLGAENYSREGQSESRFNDVLKSTSMEVNSDTTIPLSPNWEQSYQTLSHPATLGFDDLRNRFGFGRGASIRLNWPARPIVVGRWGWSAPGSDAVKQKSIQYQEGQPLGDLVLAAEEPFGRGRIVVLGDMSCLNNERLSCSHEFAGRLLGYLANRSSSPQALWRQMSAIAAMILLLGLLMKNAEATRVGATSVFLAAGLLFYTWNSAKIGAVLPDGRGQTTNNLAYIDASHLEAFSGDLWNDYGIAGFTRVLMRSGFLPLRLPELTAERLERAGLLVSMAPARQFSAEELAAVRRFVEEGGMLICLVGAEEARTSTVLLDEFQFKINPSPVGPQESIREPDPIGAMPISFIQPGKSKIGIQFFAAWPIEQIPEDYKTYITGTVDGKNWPVISRTKIGQGTVLVIADTYFAINQNLESAANEFPSHMNFWRMLLSDNTGKEVENSPVEPIQERGPAE